MTLGISDAQNNYTQHDNTEYNDTECDDIDRYHTQ